MATNQASRPSVNKGTSSKIHSAGTVGPIRVYPFIFLFFRHHYGPFCPLQSPFLTVFESRNLDLDEDSNLRPSGFGARRKSGAHQRSEVRLCKIALPTHYLPQAANLLAVPR